MASNTTISPNSSTAVEKCFAVPELLTHILSYINPTELLHCTRVSITFRSTIAEAPTLQHALFPKPNWARPLHRRVQNAFLNNVFQRLVTTDYSLGLPGGRPRNMRIAWYDSRDDIRVPFSTSGSRSRDCQSPARWRGRTSVSRL